MNSILGAAQVVAAVILLLRVALLIAFERQVDHFWIQARKGGELALVETKAAFP